jgi:hypothetical protein
MRSGGIYGFGGIQDRFDLIMPPGKLANIITDSMGLVSLSVLKNRLRHLWTVIVKN